MDDKQDKRVVIVAVFAHPDDEMVVSGLLSRANDRGMETHLVCATRGEAGRIRNPQIVDKENQADIRAGELEQSCAVLGVSSLTFLDLPDNGASNWCQQAPEEKLLELWQAVKPDIVVTFDDNGGNGHPDHKEIAALTVRAFARYKERGTQRLYLVTLFPQSFLSRFFRFVPIPKKVKEKAIRKLTVDDHKVTSIVKLTRAEKKRKLSAVSCHRSQFPDENGRYYKMPYWLFKKFSTYECYYLCDGEGHREQSGYRKVDML